MNDRSEIDDAWGELLDDEPPPAPTPAVGSNAASGSAEAVPPPPTFTPLVAERRRGDSVVESMQNLMKADSGAAREPDDESRDEVLIDAAVSDASTTNGDAATSSGSMPKLWEALWADAEPPANAEPRDEDSVAALLPLPPVLSAPERSPGEADESGVGLRLAPAAEPEPPARIGPDPARTSPPSIEQSVELKRPPRVAEEASSSASPEREYEDEVEDVPVRAAVVARAAEEAPVVPRAKATPRAQDSDPALTARPANTRPRAVWIGGAALLATAAIVGISMRGSDAPTSSTTPPRTPAVTPEVSAEAPPRVAAGPPDAAPPRLAEAAPPEPAEAAPPSPDEAAPPSPAEPTKAAAADPKAEPAAPADPADAEPTDEADAPEPVEGSDPPVKADAANGSGSAAYDAAKAEYEASGSQDALAKMVEAACAMDDGPSARSAFRKLRPTELRKAALSACKATEIDPTLSIEGSTPGELVRRARRELQAGDPAAALSTARESNRMKRSSDAIAVMVLAACAQSDAEEARRLRKHVAKADRAEVDAACAAKGIDPSAPAE